MQHAVTARFRQRNADFKNVHKMIQIGHSSNCGDTQRIWIVSWLCRC